MTTVCENRPASKLETSHMTAEEMVTRYTWVDMTVSFGFKTKKGTPAGGHVHVEGRTRLVEGDYALRTVWVGPVALPADIIVSVDREIGTEGAKVYVYPHLNNV